MPEATLTSKTLNDDDADDDEEETFPKFWLKVTHQASLSLNTHVHSQDVKYFWKD